MVTAAFQAAQEAAGNNLDVLMEALSCLCFVQLWRIKGAFWCFTGPIKRNMNHSHIQMYIKYLNFPLLQLVLKRVYQSLLRVKVNR